MKSRYVLFFILLFGIAQICIGQEDLPVFIKDSLDTYLKEQQEKWKIPALAVAIVKDGKVVKQYVNGVTDYTSNTPIDEHSLFMIGSNTKAFTAILMATLADENAFSLEDPVKKWLPYFKLYDPYLTKHVNIIDVLSHRVGFETFQGDFLNFDNDLTSEEIIRKFALIKPTYGFRERWGYFNTGYTIAGQIIEKATGKTWATQIQERIFTPIGMTNSLALSKEMQTAANRTLAHTIIDGEAVVIDYGDIDATAPAGSISSSIVDMSKWVIALLNNGKVNDKQVIPVNAINETITPRSFMGAANDPFNLYGLGWDIKAVEEHTLVMHTGGIHGYVTSVTTVPKENLGIIILTNTDSNYLFEGMKYDILGPFIDVEPLMLSDKYHAFYTQSKMRDAALSKELQKQVAKKEVPSVSLDEFTGRYVNEVYGWLDITKRQDGLRISFEHHKELYVSLAHLENDTFLASFNNVLYGESIFPFEVEDGKVKKFTLKLDPQVENTTYDFYKQ
jgi:CubicO group peptidase (beta-lactamase class C family)